MITGAIQPDQGETKLNHINLITIGIVMTCMGLISFWAILSGIIFTILAVFLAINLEMSQITDSIESVNVEFLN